MDHSLPACADVIAAWPARLSFATDFSSNGASPIAEAEIEATRCKLRKFANPVGKYLAGDSPGGNIRRGFEHALLNRNATLIVLAARLYELKHGRLPASLGELNAEDLLPGRLPLDPFCDAPLGYSAERQWLWSVGPEGDYQPQSSLPEDEWGPDLQWSLATG